MADSKNDESSPKKPLRLRRQYVDTRSVETQAKASTVSATTQTSGGDDDANRTLAISHEYVLNLNLVKYPGLYEHFRNALSVDWNFTEIHLEKDLADWQRLDAASQNCVKQILSFFVAGDGIVIANLVRTLYPQAAEQEVQLFYGQQIKIETVHAFVYTILLRKYAASLNEERELARGVDTSPTIRAKGAWANRWITATIETAHDYMRNILAYLCVEGIFFAGSFAFIFDLVHDGRLPGLLQSNQLIARDENLHCDFACDYFILLNDRCTEADGGRLPVQIVHEIFREAVTIELSFWRDLFAQHDVSRVRPFMTYDRMQTYIESIADRLLVAIGYDVIWGASNPFPFMLDYAHRIKTNQFEARPVEYQTLEPLPPGSDLFDLVTDDVVAAL